MDPVSSTTRHDSLPVSSPTGLRHTWLYHKSHCCATRKYAASCFRPVRQLLKFPAVHAAELVTEEAEASVHALEPITHIADSRSMFEVLMNKRPELSVDRDAEIQAYLSQETGKERLTEMYSKDDHGHYSPEILFACGSAFQCGGMAFLVMSTLGALQAKDNFIRNNKATKFDTKFIAARRFHDAIILGGLKAGFKWALIIAFFSGTYMGINQTIAVYRNKSGIREHMVAGFVTGSIVRMQLGLKGFIAGGIIGSAMGVVAGTAMYGLLAVSNETQEHRHYWVTQKKLEEKREVEILTLQANDVDTLEGFKAESATS